MTKQRIYISIMTIVIFLLSVVTVGQLTPALTVSAVVTTENNFDSTAVEDDLADVDFNVLKENTETISILEFVEYCYTDNIFDQGNYGLYLYVANPAKLTFSTRDGINVINIATRYDDKGEPNAYRNVPLKYCAATMGDNARFVYKFKVADVSGILSTQKEYNKTYGERRYDIAGIQLREMGTALSKDYSIGGTWHYTGYAKGYGSETGTIKCTKTELETVQLDVTNTFYRPKGTNGNGMKQDTLYSVYFAVPNRLLRDYGFLYAVTAEWLYAKLKPILVLDDNGVNDRLQANQIGKTVADREKYPIGFGTDLKYNYPMGSDSDWCTWFAGTMYNTPKDVAYNEKRERYEGGGGTVFDAAIVFHEMLNQLYYSFSVDLGLFGSIENASVSAETILSYMDDYTQNRFPNDERLLGKYSKNLFESYDNEKTVKQIFASDNMSLTSQVIGSSLWSQIWGLRDTVTYDGIQAIKQVAAADITTPDETCRRLYIDRADWDGFYSLYEESSKPENDKTVFLLRFAVDSDYQSNYATVFEYADNADNFTTLTSNAYLAKGMAAYLDFDIIDLTFKRNGVYTVIPVVANPIDIISDVTAPPYENPNGCNNVWLLLAILLGVVVFIVLSPILVPLIKWLLQILWWIISAPFRFIVWVVNSFKSENNDKASAPKRQTKKRRKKKRK